MSRAPLRANYQAGVAASLAAEAVFVALVMALAALRGKDMWHVTRAPASLVIGPNAVHPPGFVAGDVVLGLAMHLWLSILVGIIYAMLLPRLRLSPLVGGLIAGGVLYALGTWILPAAFPVWLSAMHKPPAGRLIAAATHAVYGAVFGLTYRGLVHVSPRA